MRCASLRAAFGSLLHFVHPSGSLRLAISTSLRLSRFARLCIGSLAPHARLGLRPMLRIACLGSLQPPRLVILKSSPDHRRILTAQFHDFELIQIHCQASAIRRQGHAGAKKAGALRQGHGGAEEEASGTMMAPITTSFSPSWASSPPVFSSPFSSPAVSAIKRSVSQRQALKAPTWFRSAPS